MLYSLALMFPNRGDPTLPQNIPTRGQNVRSSWALQKSPVTSSSYCSGSRQYHPSSRSQCWSVPSQIDGNIAWNVMWGYIDILPRFVLTLALNWYLPTVSGILHRRFKTRCLHDTIKVPDAAGFDQCCRQVDTIFTLLWFPLSDQCFLLLVIRYHFSACLHGLTQLIQMSSQTQLTRLFFGFLKYRFLLQVITLSCELFPPPALLLVDVKCVLGYSAVSSLHWMHPR